MRDTVGLPVTGPSQVGEARRIAASPAGLAGFDGVGRGEVAPIVVEGAGGLYRDFARARDDSTVVVARERRPRPS